MMDEAWRRPAVVAGTAGESRLEERRNACRKEERRTQYIDATLVLRTAASPWIPVGIRIPES